MIRNAETDPLSRSYSVRWPEFRWNFGLRVLPPDPLLILGKSDAKKMFAAVVYLMGRLKLPINAQKSRCLWCPEEPFPFLGYDLDAITARWVGGLHWHATE